MSHEGALRVEPIDGPRDLDQFIRLPWTLYAHDPAWVPPLLVERRQLLSPRSPYCAHARWQGWVARRGASPVGRISAQIDRLYVEHHEAPVGFFGMLDAGEDPEAFAALLRAAETWLGEQGMHRVHGPYNLSINQEAGLLIEGFHTPPMFGMAHNHRYYGSHVEAQGYVKAKDLLAYWLDLGYETPKAVRRTLKRLSRRITHRSLRRGAFDDDVELVREIFNDAWSGNWGFIPFTREEFQELGRSYKLLITNDFVQIVELDGEPAAMMVSLPNLNEVIRDLDGRLLPHGWLKLLWRIKVRFPSTARVALMGVRRRYHGTPLGIALAFTAIEASREAAAKLGVRGAELSWILEDNKGMRSIIESLGGVPYKRYRIYEKALA